MPFCSQGIVASDDASTASAASAAASFSTGGDASTASAATPNTAVAGAGAPPSPAPPSPAAGATAAGGAAGITGATHVLPSGGAPVHVTTASQTGIQGGVAATANTVGYSAGSHGRSAGGSDISEAQAVGASTAKSRALEADSAAKGGVTGQDPVKDAPAEKTVNVDGTISSTGAPRNALDAAAKSANGAAKPVQVTESQADEGRGGVSIRGDYIEDDFESIDLPS
uniref:Uncharacterized protein n=1 Tax=Globisporangium ultimum (strain ATCC 200006 / CBS 805.95 / DAOM BR144) TaxID=431595 RepID=K3WP68_GLOUD